MKAKLLLLLAAMLLATGCASSRMVDSAQQELIAPSANKAQVVFLRSSFLGSAIQSVIYDATGDGADFIAILSNGKKLAHTVEPGNLSSGPRARGPKQHSLTPIRGRGP